MTWIKLDDQFPNHPKVLAAGPLATLLHISALCYAGQYLTDGFIPAGALPKLVDFDGISVATGGVPGMYEDIEEPNVYDLAARLLEVGLWESTQGGYIIHDYLEYNPSRQQVMKEREAARERMAKGREVRNDNHHSSLEIHQNNGQNSSEVHLPPTPTPTPINTTMHAPGECEAIELGAAKSAAPEVSTQSPGKVQRKSRKPPERKSEELALMQQFLTLTGLTLPAAQREQNWWYSELREILRMAGGAGGKAGELLAHTVREMQGKQPPLTITSPKSIVGMANALNAERKQGYVL